MLRRTSPEQRAIDTSLIELLERQRVRQQLLMAHMIAVGVGREFAIVSGRLELSAEQQEELAAVQDAIRQMAGEE